MLNKEQLDNLDNKFGHKAVDLYVRHVDDKKVRKAIGDKVHMGTDVRAALEQYAIDLDNITKKLVVNASEITFSDLTERLKKLMR